MKKYIKPIKKIKVISRVYKRMHTGDSPEFVKGFLEGLETALVIIRKNL